MAQFWLESEALALVLVLTVIAFWSAKSWHHTRHLPPGPFAWPVVGNLLQLGNQPHRSLAKLSRKYGPLMLVRFGTVDTVIVSSPDMAKEFLQTYDRIFSSRPMLIAGDAVTYNCRDMAFAPMGPGWRQVRRVFMSELLNTDRIASFQTVRKEEVLSSLNSIFQVSSRGMPIQIIQVLFELTFNVISRMMQNKRYFGPGVDKTLGESDEFIHCIHEFFKLAGHFNIGDFIPSLRRFDLQGIEKRFRAIHKSFDSFLQTIIDEHRAKRKQTDDHDSGFVDFIDAVMNLSTKLSDGEKELSDTQMKATIIDAFFAGTETQATTLEWTFTELIRHPEELRKAREELDRVVGRERLVEESDLLNLPYLRNILKEIFRLHPTGPLLIPHESTEACSIAGYNLPAKTRMLCNVWAIGRDTNIWGEDVEEFRPQRFEKLYHLDWKGRNFELIPFGSGRRICPGMGMSEILMHYTLAQLLHACDWALPQEQTRDDVDLAEHYGLTLSKAVHLELIANPRLQPRAYTESNIDTQQR